MDSQFLTEIKNTLDYLSNLVKTASNGSVASSKKTQKKCNREYLPFIAHGLLEIHFSVSKLSHSPADLSMRPEKAVKQITWKSKSQDSQGNEKGEDRNAKVKSKTLKTDTNSVRTDKGSSKPIKNKDSDDSGDSDESDDSGKDENNRIKTYRSYRRDKRSASESDYDTSSTDGTE